MEGSSAVLSPSPPWIELPRDLTVNILHRLSVVEVLESAQKVCTTWWRVCHDPSMWRVIVIKNKGGGHLYKKYSLICRHTVDRSQGQLIDISLEHFGDDELLNYICERSNNIKRLALARCNGMSTDGFTKAIRRIPQLEELHLDIMGFINGEEVMETIGISCPMLKSFTYNKHGSKYPHTESTEDPVLRGPDPNAYALAIAKSMPNLCHLQIFADTMTNVGLEAILDGCPQLESLDIRQCLNVDLGGDLDKRLSQQIKSLRRPLDSTDNYEWDGIESWRDFMNHMNDIILYGGINLSEMVSNATEMFKSLDPEEVDDDPWQYFPY